MEHFKARLILEILGRPASNVVEALALLIDKMGQEKDVKVLNKKIHEPKLLENGKDLFTTFAEVEIQIGSIQTLFHILFTYMPANIEIIEPEKVEIKNQDFNQSANYLMHRLHQYDSIAKSLLGERDFLAKKLYEFAPNLFKKNPNNPSESVNPEAKPEQKEDKKENKKQKAKKSKK